MMLMDMLMEIVRISDFVQAATDDRLGFGLLGYDDPFEAMLTGSNPAVFPDEVRRTGALHEQLGHDRIVVVVDRQMAIAAGFCLVGSRRPSRMAGVPTRAPSDRVRNVGAKCDPAESLAADGLLLDVDRFSIAIVTPNMDGTGAASRSDAVPSDISIPSDHVDIVPKGLKVIGDAVA